MYDAWMVRGLVAQAARIHGPLIDADVADSVRAYAWLERGLVVAERIDDEKNLSALGCCLGIALRYAGDLDASLQAHRAGDRGRRGLRTRPHLARRPAR